VLRGEYDPFDDTFSDAAKDIVSRLLVVNPSQRINAAQCAQHRFFVKVGRCKLTLSNPR
jgi:serine/threonine protein kinase